MKSSEGLNIEIKFIFPFTIFEPLGNNIFVPFLPYIEFNISKTAGVALLIPSKTTNLLGKLSTHSIA